jgi:hypothetical protein
LPAAGFAARLPAAGFAARLPAAGFAARLPAAGFAARVSAADFAVRVFAARAPGCARAAGLPLRELVAERFAGRFPEEDVGVRRVAWLVRFGFTGG